MLMLISIEWHKNISVQLWYAPSNTQIQKSTVYEGCSISSRPKVEADVFNGWQLAKMKKSIPDMSLP